MDKLQALLNEHKNKLWHHMIIDDVEWKYKIIWHPVMIWDVLDWFYSNIELPVVERRRTCDTILFEWKDKRKPLQDQPIECIEYIYNLLSNDR